MFTKLGKKIIADAYRTDKPLASKAVVDDDNDDSFQRYKGGSLCEQGDDVYYHGGGGHDHGHGHSHGDEELTED